MESSEPIPHHIIEVSIANEFDLQQLASLWAQLESSAKPTYFLSWGWIGTWLESLPEALQPILLVAQYNNEIVGLALLLNGKRSTKGIRLPSRTLVVHETGDPYYDLLCIEYNGFLIAKQHQPEATLAFLKYLGANLRNWDELLIRAADSCSALTNAHLVKQVGLGYKIHRSMSSWYVDLKAIRKEGSSYLDNLSSNTRYQIRRALRECEKHGHLDFSTAGSVEEAQEYLSRLIGMNQTYWNNKGRDGVFSNPYFLAFHRSLINKRFDIGEIQLIRIKLNDVELSYLYNFVYNGEVSYYQSGFNYDLSGTLKPGLVAHYKAIEHNLEKGMAIYSFLASDDRYKRSLSTQKHDLLWISLQRHKLRFDIENAFESILSNCKSVAKRGRDLYRQHRYTG